MPQDDEPVRILYALFATEEIRFGHNTAITSFDSSAPEKKFKPPLATQSNAFLYSHGIVRIEGDISIDGNIFGNTDPPIAGTYFCTSEDETSPPQPPILAPALKAPITAQQSAVLTREQRLIGRFLPNDYIVSEPVFTVPPAHKRPVRLFVVDSDSESEVYALKFSGFGQNVRTPSDVQIWYNGARIIQLCLYVNALVYAPNATVEISFNSHFSGAIVAHRIIGQGNNTFSCDSRLINTEYK